MGTAETSLKEVSSLTEVNEATGWMEEEALEIRMDLM